MRAALLTTVSFALVLVALAEWGLAFPVPRWLYLTLGLAFVVALVRPTNPRSQLRPLGALSAVLALLAALHLVDWTTRKPFLRDLDRIQIGMTEAEARQVMGRYLEGTGWPANPFQTNSVAPGTLTDLGSGSSHATTHSPSGELVLARSLVFRHSNDGAFNSDWGIVSLSHGRVTGIQFSPD
jgi:hypothetical protein